MQKLLKTINTRCTIVVDKLGLLSFVSFKTLDPTFAQSAVYKQAVKEPAIDLATVQTRLEQRQYSTVKQTVESGGKSADASISSATTTTTTTTTTTAATATTSTPATATTTATTTSASSATTISTSGGSNKGKTTKAPAPVLRVVKRSHFNVFKADVCRVR